MLEAFMAVVSGDSGGLNWLPDTFPRLFRTETEGLSSSVRKYLYTVLVSSSPLVKARAAGLLPPICNVWF